MIDYMIRYRIQVCRIAAVAALFLLLLSVTTAWAQVPAQSLTLNWEKMAHRMVRQLSLQPGERVLLLAHGGKFDELIPPLRYAVIQAGGIDLGVHQVLSKPFPAEWKVNALGENAVAARSAFRKMLDEVDVGIMLPGAIPSDPVYAAMQDRLRGGLGRVIHFHWDETSAFPLPGQPLPPRYIIEATYQKALLQTDYGALARMQRRFERSARAGEIRVTTPLGTDLRFRIGDRPMNFQDGDASADRARNGVVLIDREIELPAGVIRVAPLEKTVEGIIAFPPSQWNGRPVEGLKLTFHGGQVVGVEVDKGKNAVESEMDRAGPAGRSFREFALGFNPYLAVPEQNPWIPYYGYGSGVVRLSLGDNSELGGVVKGGYVRWNFFAGATVTAGGLIWVKDGKLTPPPAE